MNHVTTFVADDLPNHLRDDASCVVCTKCQRKSWDMTSQGQQCRMPQPGGYRCDGVLERIAPLPLAPGLLSLHSASTFTLGPSPPGTPTPSPTDSPLVWFAYLMGEIEQLKARVAELEAEKLNNTEQ